MSSYRGANQGRDDIRSWFTLQRKSKSYVNKTYGGIVAISSTDKLYQASASYLSIGKLSKHRQATSSIDKLSKHKIAISSTRPKSFWQGGTNPIGIKLLGRFN